MNARSTAKACCGALAAATMLCWSTGALSQAADFPTRPVTINVPYDAGSSHDRILRIYIKAILEATGKQFLLSFRPGGGTTIGTGFVAKAAPDGYNLLDASPSISIIPSVYNNLSFDPIGDFAPVSLLTKQAYFLVVNAASPFKSLQDYLAYARANPGKINWGTSGAGSPSHLPGEYLHNLARSEVTFVHYKSGAQRFTDLAAGRTDVTMGSLGNIVALTKAGKIRALAVTTSRRIPSAPDMPTFDEEGVKGYDFSGWLGMVVPVRTPPAVIARLNSFFVIGGRDPEVRKLESDGSLIVNSTPAELGTLIRTEADIWSKLIKERGLKVDPE